jgi:dipeptidase E
VTVKQQIIAMGGGGFSMEPNNSLLDEYVLQHARQRNPRVCFVPTASGDSADYTIAFYDAFKKFRCRPTHLFLLRPSTPDLEGFVMEQDVIYVGGGNTKNLMALWKAWTLDDILRKAWREGVMLAGISAGSICWFELGVTDSIPGKLTPLECLGFLKGSNCPHYDSEKERRPSFQRLVAKGMISAGLAADDGVALHFEGDRFVGAVSSRPNALAYQVTRKKNKAEEILIQPRYLGRSK